MVPQPPRFKPGLPADEPGAGGTWLPTPLDEAVGFMIDYCRYAYPTVVETALDEVRTQGEVKAEGLLEIQRRQFDGEMMLQQHPDPGWPTWMVAVLSFGVGMVTLGAGLAAGYLLGQVAP